MCDRDCDADGAGVRTVTARYLEVLARSLPHVRVQEGDKICETCHSKAYRGGAAHRPGVRGRPGKLKVAGKAKRTRTPKPYELLKGDKTKRQRIDAAMDKSLPDLEKTANAVLQPGERALLSVLAHADHPGRGRSSR